MNTAIRRLLRAVEAHRPYACTSPKACLEAWKRVSRQVWYRKLNGHLYAEGYLYQSLEEFSTGQFLTGAEDDPCYQLMTKIAADVTHCESVGRVRIRIHEVESTARTIHDEELEDTVTTPTEVVPPRVQVEDENEARAPETRQSKRLREQQHKETPGEAPPPRRRKTRTAVDRESVEQFVDLLLEHVPHRATDPHTAWGRVLNGLPAGNALRNRSLYKLKERYNLLAGMMEGGTDRQRAKLTPEIEHKFHKYRALVTSSVETEETSHGESTTTNTATTPTATTAPATEASSRSRTASHERSRVGTEESGRGGASSWSGCKPVYSALWSAPLIIASL